MRVWVVGAIVAAGMWTLPIAAHALQSSTGQNAPASGPIALRVTAFRGNIRQSASATAPVIKAVPLGTLLEGVRRDKDWFVVQVELSDGRLHDGFVSSSIVEVATGSSASGGGESTPSDPVPLPSGSQGTTPAAAPRQDVDPKEYVRQQLQDQYVPTKMALDGTTVLRGGAVPTIEKEGVGANMISGTLSGLLVTFVNNYKDGNIKQSVPSRLLIPSDLIRSLQVGEGVYVLKVEVKDTEIVVTVQSCGNCIPTAPDPNFVPYKAAIAFQFPKDYLRTPDVGRIQETIGQVLNLAPPASAPATQQSAPLADAAVGAPIPPPAEPATIGLGQTVDQVVAALGSPPTVIKLETKEIYVYKDLKITFVNGKVSDVE